MQVFLKLYIITRICSWISVWSCCCLSVGESGFLHFVCMHTSPGLWWSPHLINISSKQLHRCTVVSCLAVAAITTLRVILSVCFSVALTSLDMWTRRFPPGFSLPITLSCRLYLSVLFFRLGKKNKTVEHKGCTKLWLLLFSRKKKKISRFFILLCTVLSWKQTKVKSVIFPQRK